MFVEVLRKAPRQTYENTHTPIVSNKILYPVPTLNFKSWVFLADGVEKSNLIENSVFVVYDDPDICIDMLPKLSITAYVIILISYLFVALMNDSVM